MRAGKVTASAGLVAAVLISAALTVGSPVQAASSGSTLAVKHGTTAAPTHTRAALTSKPPALTAQQRQQRASRPAFTPAPSQTFASGPSPAAARKPAATVAHNAPASSHLTPSHAASPSGKPVSGAPTDFTQWRNTSLAGAPSGNSADTVDEPSTSNDGNVVWYTGNWYAALSNDSGNTFSYVNPYSFGSQPANSGGFCCDQVTIHDPINDLTSWVLLYCNASNCSTGQGDNVIRLAFANSQSALSTASFYYYDFSAQTFGYPEGDWVDYPHVTVDAHSYYLTVNIFDGTQPNNNFIASVIVRFNLAQLAAAGGVNYTYASTNQVFTWTPASSTGTTAYFAATGGNLLRIFNWPEGGGIASNDFSLGFSYENKNGACTAPDGNNWCAFDDSRVKTGWISGNTLGFMWDAAQDGTYAYPYIYVAEFDISGGTPSYLSSPLLNNGSYAYAYPGAGVDAAGNLAVSMAVGCCSSAGGYPEAAVAIVDDVTGMWAPLVLDNNGAHATARWGDFLTARPATGPGYTTNTWIATGYTLRDDGFGGSITTPDFFWFGRLRDDPFVPTLTNDYSNNATEGISAGLYTSAFYGPSNCTCDYYGVTYWGDGGGDYMTLVPAGTPYFYLYSPHTYTEEGNYTTSNSVYDYSGNSSSGTGSTAVADAALTASGGPTASLAEGGTFSGVVATFSDADPNDTAGDYTATIYWSDGSTSTGTVAASGGGFQVTGSHTYTEGGTYSVFTFITDAGGSSAFPGMTIKVSDPKLTGGAPTTITSIEGGAFTGKLGTFSDADTSTTAGEYTATIKWGDFTAATTGTVSSLGGGQYKVGGTHTYAEEGSFNITITVVDAGGSTTTMTSKATVTDAKLTGVGVAFQPIEGGVFTGKVANFNDGDPGKKVADFKASIVWGDGTTTTGTVSGDGGSGFKVGGTHTYAEEGQYTVKVTVTDTGGSVVTTTLVETVKDAALHSTGTTSSGKVNQALTTTVATFTDGDPGRALGDYTATIKWGDGVSSSGTVAASGTGFKVTGTHTYTTTGTFPISVTIVDHAATTVASSSANITAGATGRQRPARSE